VDEFHGGWQPALFTKTPAWFQSEQLFDGAAGGGNCILPKVTLAVLGLALKSDFLQFALIILHKTQILPDRRGRGSLELGMPKFHQVVQNCGGERALLWSRCELQSGNKQ
jgi:hypothetical protein